MLLHFAIASYVRLVNFGGSFQALLESVLLVPVPLLPEGLVLCGRVSTSLALSVDRPLGPPMAASEPLWAGISLPCCYN